MARVVHDLTDAQWVALTESWGGCAYCGGTDRPLQRDCVQAVSRGGRYTVDNVVPACGPCNASKGNQEVTGWLRRRRYDERAFLLRYLEVRQRLAPAGGDSEHRVPARQRPAARRTEEEGAGEAVGDGDAGDQLERRSRGAGRDLHGHLDGVTEVTGVHDQLERARR